MIKKLCIIVTFILALNANETIPKLTEEEIQDIEQIEKEQDEIWTSYAKDCESGIGLGCYFIAKSYKYDSPENLEYHKKGCKGNYSLSCNILGYRFSNAIGVERNILKSLKYYLKACNFDNNEDDCNNFRRLYSLKNKK